MSAIRILACGLILCCLSSCFHPPFHGFYPEHPVASAMVTGATVGTLAGGVAYGNIPGAVGGGLAGGAVGALIGLQKDSKRHIIQELRRQDIQFISYGDTMTLVVPVDKYYMFNSPRLNEACCPALNNIIKLLEFYPESAIYVAGFTDNVGSRCHKKLLSQAQAETMLTFLWSFDIPAEALKSEGYGDKHPISDNKLIHGSAQNRRIEIQWFTSPVDNKPRHFAEMTK
ncbi:MAG: OmpA family protein [Legionella sp.]|nr:OmpA family protein [Legionella sp.]